MGPWEVRVVPDRQLSLGPLGTPDLSLAIPQMFVRIIALKQSSVLVSEECFVKEDSWAIWWAE